MNYNDCFKSLHLGLPEDIARLKAAGYYREAIARIDVCLAEDWAARQNSLAYQNLAPRGTPAPENPVKTLPQPQRDAMMAQREMLALLPRNYTYTKAQALALLQERIADFTGEEFEALFAENRLDWRFVDGEIKISRRFYASLVDTEAAYAQRAGKPHTGERAAQRDAAIAQMQVNGQMQARITLRAQVQAKDEAFAAALAKAKAQGKDSVTVKAWLPLPAACPSQSDIEVLHTSETPQGIAPETAPARTIYWEKECTENQAFWVEYAYTQTAKYHDVGIGGVDALRCAAVPEAPLPADFAPDLAEQAPHGLFTPTLCALVSQLTKGVSAPLEKARRIYDYITLNVHYRYMPPYFMLDDIAQTCATSRRGDCGVMALTFITMCRIAGIPAKWESALAVNPDGTGCHDWARFYIAPLGWLYADCSYGSSAARDEEHVRRAHYFGNLDVYRMVANNAFAAPLTPPKEGWREDPYDNQSGEVSLGETGLLGYETTGDTSVISFEVIG